MRFPTPTFRAKSHHSADHDHAGAFLGVVMAVMLVALVVLPFVLTRQR